MGSGNFLVIAYKRLRELEIQLLNDLQDAGVQQVDLFSQITLDNFYGIEYADFAAETAKVSLRIAEQQMDAVYGNQFNKPASILPLRAAPNIYTGSALTVSWETVCPATSDSEVYICGNPPYLGFSGRSTEQQKEHDAVMDGVFKSVSQLDYVCNWFVLATRFIKNKTYGKYAFVSTNSVIQGIHVPRLWPYITDHGHVIKFAYPSFKWSNLAGNNAGVTCVIIGVGHQDAKPKRLFTKNGEIQAENINPYLSDAPTAWVQTSNTPISSLPHMVLGSAPKDGGNLILSPDEKEQIIQLHPESKKFIRRLIGSQEMLKDIERYCLRIKNEELEEAMSIPPISARIERVRQMRLSSKKAATRKSALRPHEFDENRHVEAKLTLIIPAVSSGGRKFLPVNMLSEGEIVNNSAFMIPDAEPWHMAILSSTLHRCWLGAVAGKLKGDYRYSNSLVWNTFPMPEVSDDDNEALNKTAQKILNARHYHPDLTLGDMYNTENMGAQLLAAHKENDRVLEKIFRDKPFKSDEDRLAHLFERYAEMTKG